METLGFSRVLRQTLSRCRQRESPGDGLYANTGPYRAVSGSGLSCACTSCPHTPLKDGAGENANRSWTHTKVAVTRRAEDVTSHGVFGRAPRRTSREAAISVFKVNDVAARGQGGFLTWRGGL